MTMPQVGSLILLQLAVSFAAAFWGRHAPRAMRAAVLVSMLAVAGALLVGLGAPAMPWVVGWIWPKAELGAIGLGLLGDPMTLFGALWTVLVGMTLLLAPNLWEAEAKPWRILGGVGIGTGAGCLAWAAATPAVLLLAQGLLMFSVFMAAGSRWDSNPESAVVTRALVERGLGVLLSLVGVAVLSSTQSMLNWGETSALPSDGIGVNLIAWGFMIQTGLFPILGWVSGESESPITVRITLSSILASIPGLVFFLRAESQLKALGFLGQAEVALAVSSMAGTAACLLQKKWRGSLAAWISASGGLFLLLQGAVSGAVALPWILSFWTVGVVFAFLGQGAEVPGGEIPPTASHRNRGAYAQIPALAALWSAGAGVGFVPFSSLVAAMALFSDKPTAALAFGLGSFAFSLGTLRIYLTIRRIGKFTELSWLTLSCLGILVLLTTQVAWTGRWLGAGLDLDAVSVWSAMGTWGPSALEHIYGQGEFWIPTALRSGIGFDPSMGLWLAVGIAALGALFGYWSAGRGEDGWLKFSERFPRFASAADAGFGVEWIAGLAVKGSALLGARLERASAETLWDDLLAKPSSRILGLLGAAVGSIEDRCYRALKRTVLLLGFVPARGAEMTQSGDVRTYVLFGIGSGVLLLLLLILNRG